MSRSEVGIKAQDIYDSLFRSVVESGNFGRYVFIDVNSCDYELGDDYLAPTKALHARHDNASLDTLRIGHAAVGRI